MLPVTDPAQTQGPLRLLDVRDAGAFAAGHAPGAVRVPIEDWVKAARTPEGDFSRSDHWHRAIRALGLGEGVTAGIYDDGRMTEAARVWFILQHFGVDCTVLNGGYPGVDMAGLTGADATPANLTLAPGTGRVGLTDRAALKAQLDRVAIMDTRTDAEFQGQDLRANARGGRLPGAVLLPHSDLLDADRLRPPAELRARFEKAGFTAGQTIVTHCEGGARAALAALAALQAGYAQVSVYYLSFSDWAADEICPVVTPL